MPRPNQPRAEQFRAASAGERSAQRARAGGTAPPADTALSAVAHTPAWRSHLVLVPLLLAINAALAITSLVGDSPTFDETAHVASGLTIVRTGDYRLSPEHPPLGKMWCTWPLLLTEHKWPAIDNSFWVQADLFGFGQHLLYELNDGQRLVVIARCMMVVLLSATCLTIYALARTLFGASAALLAVAVAALSPTLLAHGRLVTTDLPVTLALALTLLTFGRLMERVTVGRVLAAGLALGAASVGKFSWPLVLPALALMLGVTIYRQRTQGRRVLLVMGACLGMGLIAWANLWTCYGWRNSVVAPLPAAQDSPAARAQLESTRKAIASWRQAMYDADGRPQPGFIPGVLRVAYEHRLLPEPYLVGLSIAIAISRGHESYLVGTYSFAGQPLYFPIVFALKTPLATQALLLAGIAALARRRITTPQRTLLIGVVAFACVYAVYSVNTGINIGQRHLLPLYPLVYAFAGAAAAWAARPLGRWLLGAALVWLVAANLRNHPHYLSYFNELIGGPARGHLYLVDSNLDWGQDLLRLADYARRHPEERIKLAYFGSAVPTRYLPCGALPSFRPFEPQAELTAGTYVVSATQLLGVYEPHARDAFWAPEAQRAFHEIGLIAAAELPASAPAELRAQQAQAREEYPYWRACRLLNRLAKRPPDERIGYSLFVYRLFDATVAELTRP
jgi:4-amino-4-deoxy-L-arabinose transferase-like glycosyltransferase